MPGLDLLAENGHDAVAVFLEERVAEGRRVDGFEELCAEGADVVEVWKGWLLAGDRSCAWCELTQLQRVHGFGLD